MKYNCLTCSNRVGKDHCTMFKDMKVAMHKQCDGYLQLPEKRKVESLSNEQVMEMRRRLESKSNAGMEDYNFGSNFIDFLKNGGHWCLNIGNGEKK